MRDKWQRKRHGTFLRVSRTVITAVFALCTHVYAGTANPLLERPTLGKPATIVIDAYWQNTLSLGELTKNKNIVAIIHKASEGLTFKDCKYHQRKMQAKANGYLWGSFHLGTNADVKRQVDEYLRYAQPEADELMAIDVEGLAARDISVDSAIRFADMVRDRTGRYPVLYTTWQVLQSIKPSQREALSKLPLWYVRYKDRPEGVPAEIWSKGPVLWQFASEEDRNYPIAGADRNIDVNLFDGSVDDLRRQWPFSKAKTPRSLISNGAAEDVKCPK